MSVSVKIELDKRSTKKDGRLPLKLLIVVNRESLRISLGYSVFLKDWNEKLQCVKNSCTDFDNVSRLNNWLLKEKSRTLGRLISLKEQGLLDRLSSAEVKIRIDQKGEDAMTLELFDSIIKEMEKSNRFGNARVYDTTARSINNFVKGKDFHLKQITYSWLKKYEAWYLSKGNTINGLSVHLRTLRALYNMAIKQRKISIDYYPFKDYSIQSQETRKRAISREDIIKFVQYEPQTKRQKQAKDYFLISFYLMGASFIDIALLKVKNIIQNRIEYKRQKTGKLHSIPLTQPLEAIIKPYLKGKNQDEFILEIVKSVDVKNQLIQAREALRVYNKSLKNISFLCGIDSPISSYVARHSYATNAKKLGVPTAIISEALGHTTEKTTRVYLDSFENDTIDKYHKLIIAV